MQAKVRCCLHTIKEYTMAKRTEKPTWEYIKEVTRLELDPSWILEDETIENAIVQNTRVPVFHKNYSEQAYKIESDLWLVALKDARKLQQHAWRIDRYAEPTTVATWAAFRSSAERAQLRKIALDGFKAEHGQYTRPSIKDLTKAVIDENEIKKLLDEGKGIQEIADMCTTHRNVIYKIAFMHQKHLKLVE